jgi:hypothetical protein
MHCVHALFGFQESEPQPSLFDALCFYEATRRVEKIRLIPRSSAPPGVGLPMDRDTSRTDTPYPSPHP